MSPLSSFILLPSSKLQPSIPLCLWNSLSDLRKKRGSISGLVTHISYRQKEMEDHPTNPDNLASAAHYVVKLEALGQEFNKLQFWILMLTDDETELEKQQEVLDRHDEACSSTQAPENVQERRHHHQVSVPQTVFAYETAVSLKRLKVYRIFS